MALNHSMMTDTITHKLPWVCLDDRLGSQFLTMAKELRLLCLLRSVSEAEYIRSGDC